MANQSYGFGALEFEVSMRRIPRAWNQEIFLDVFGRSFERLHVSACPPPWRELRWVDGAHSAMSLLPAIVANP
jgi:hypothetical protein